MRFIVHTAEVVLGHRSNRSPRDTMAVPRTPTLNPNTAFVTSYARDTQSEKLERPEVFIKLLAREFAKRERERDWPNLSSLVNWQIYT